MVIIIITVNVTRVPKHTKREIIVSRILIYRISSMIRSAETFFAVYIIIYYCTQRPKNLSSSRRSHERFAPQPRHACVGGAICCCGVRVQGAG